MKMNEVDVLQVLLYVYHVAIYIPQYIPLGRLE